MRRIVAILAALALVPLAAQAQHYRCVGADGKRYYGSTIPPECYKRPVEELNSQGLVVKRIDQEGAERERRAKEAAEAKKRIEEAATKEALRRDRALLATYTSEKDIDDARERALSENTKAIQEVEARIDSIRKRQLEYQKQLVSYKAGDEVPARLRDDLKNAEDDLNAQQQLLEVKKRDVQNINTRYDEDKKRYVAITRR